VRGREGKGEEREDVESYRKSECINSFASSNLNPLNLHTLHAAPVTPKRKGK